MDELNFHDATILKGEYNQEIKELSLLIEVSGCMQHNYRKGDPELLVGTYVLSSVDWSKELEELFKLVNLNEQADAEVLNHSEKEIHGSTVTKLFLRIEDYSKHEEEYLELTIASTKCEWQEGREL
jgi:hypothetical protein